MTLTHAYSTGVRMHRDFATIVYGCDNTMINIGGQKAL